MGIKVFVVERKTMDYGIVFNDEEKLSHYICSNQENY